MSISAPIVVILLASGPANPSSTTPVPTVPVTVSDTFAGIQDAQVPPTAAIPAIAAEAVPAVALVEAPVQTTPASPSTSSSEDQSDIVVTGRHATPGDPLERINVKSFEAIQAVDKAVIGPVALTFERVVPTPIRLGLRNVLYNLQEPVVFLNYMLQLKPGKAIETVGRFTINSTIGIAGIVDIAKSRPFKLPYRPNGFGNSLGYYGVKPGPYLFLPVIGPTTLRDLFGIFADQMVLPTAIGKPFNQSIYSVPRVLVRELDQRAGFEENLRIMRASSDFYTARRDFYLRTRQVEIDGLHTKKYRDKSVIPAKIECDSGITSLER